MSIDSNIPFLECSKISMSENSRSFMWILPCLTICGLVTAVCYTDVIQTFWVWAFWHIHEYYSPQNISTIKYLSLAARRLGNTGIDHLSNLHIQETNWYYRRNLDTTMDLLQYLMSLNPICFFFWWLLFKQGIAFAGWKIISPWLNSTLHFFLQ
jgi:hypothetical protein